MVRPLLRAARMLSLALSIAALAGCGAIAPSAARRVAADVEAASAEAASAAETASPPDEPLTPARLPSEVAGDAYCGPSQVLFASAEEPVARAPEATRASFECDDAADEPGGTAAGEGQVEAVGPADFDAVVLAAETPVLVDFAARWCGPCRRLAPVLDKLAEDRPDVKIVTVDIDQSPHLAETYRVRSVPMLLVFRQGEVAARHKGAATRAQLDQLLAR